MVEWMQQQPIEITKLQQSMTFCKHRWIMYCKKWSLKKIWTNYLELIVVLMLAVLATKTAREYLGKWEIRISLII